jgi:hypothetical protein
MPLVCARGWLKVKAATLFKKLKQSTFLLAHNFVQLARIFMAQLTFLRC